jgi:16S rRNA (adenine1518-N6/adenine1519-N6)-dimethyltransferase
MTLTEIKTVLSVRGLRPLKRFGQNFLHDQNLAQMIVRATLEEMSGVTHIVEIGPGMGAITEYFLTAGLSVTAIEVDKGLAEFLRGRFANEPRFQLVEGDALKVELNGATLSRVLAGNLPYYISTPLIARWMESPQPPERMVFTLQKEVAERLAANAGQEAYGSLSVLIQTEYRVEYLRALPPEVFYPRPDVDSAVVRLTRLPLAFPEPQTARDFRDFVRKGFSQRRKKLSNTLGIKDHRRPEEVTVKEWLELWKTTRLPGHPGNCGRA